MLSCCTNYLSTFVIEEAWDVPFEWEKSDEMLPTYFLFKQPFSSIKYFTQKFNYTSTNSE